MDVLLDTDNLEGVDFIQKDHHVVTGRGLPGFHGFPSGFDGESFGDDDVFGSSTKDRDTHAFGDGAFEEIVLRGG